MLSDLWGKQKSAWVNSYMELLSPTFEIIYYDSCTLGEINLINYSENAIHQQFINGGIDTAVTNLLEKEKREITILAFSIGGTIAWKAGLKGLKISNFFAVSSTRLRYETAKPNCPIYLCFGDLDNYRPAAGWFKGLAVANFYTLNNETHHLYKNEICIKLICDKLIKTIIA